MNQEQLQETLRWLQSQIQHSNFAIKEAQNELNFGREAQHEGMREAYMQVLNWMTSHGSLA